VEDQRIETDANLEEEVSCEEDGREEDSREVLETPFTNFNNGCPIIKIAGLQEQSNSMLNDDGVLVMTVTDLQDE
jgi:hypothetical protein